MKNIECIDVSVFIQVPDILIFYSLQQRDKKICDTLFTPLSDRDDPLYYKYMNLKKH